MEFSPVKLNRISRVYQNQVRIAELNQKNQIKSVQSQVDRVSLSPAARKLAVEAEAAQSTPAATVSAKG